MADPKKPGWKTSEAWLTAAAHILSWLYIYNVIGDAGTAGKIAAFATMALTTAGYTVSRGQLKAANATAVPPA